MDTLREKQILNDLWNRKYMEAIKNNDKNIINLKTKLLKMFNKIKNKKILITGNTGLRAGTLFLNILGAKL